MKREASPEKMPPEEEHKPEKRIIRKPCQFLGEVGITDFHYEEQEDGIHFFIKLPPEHIEQRRRQIATNLNAPDHTDFEAGPLLGFKQRLNQTQGLAWESRPSGDVMENDSEVEIVIFKAKKVKTKGGYINPTRKRIS